MEKKLIIPTYYARNDVYIYFDSGEETGKAMYEFFMSGNRIVNFTPLRQVPYYNDFNKPDYTIVLPVSPDVYTPRNLARKEMEERKETSFFYENGLHLNQSYVRDDEGALVIGEGIFRDYKKLTLVHASNCPLTWEPGTFKKNANIDIIAPEGFELRIIEHSYPTWNKRDERVYKKEYYPLVGNKKIFDEIDGYMSTTKNKYRYVSKEKIADLPNITINERQYVDGGVIKDVLAHEREF